MELLIDRLSKRFATHWVFRDLSLTIPTRSSLAVTGPNGSGKTTLLKILCGMLTPSAGRITYQGKEGILQAEVIPMEIAFAAPYTEMIEEMTLREAVHFHSRFREFYAEVSTFGDFLQVLDYPFRAGQQIRDMSSGMKQRLRLAFALCTRSSLIVLDEPSSNLDESGIRWLHSLLAQYAKDRTMIIASNVAGDLEGCTLHLELANH